MKEQLISLDTAKLAKEKGFKEMCDYAYSEDDKDVIFKDKNNNYPFRNDSMSDEVSGYISTPTQSLLQKWLREKHDIDIDIRKSFTCYNIIRICRYNEIEDVNKDLPLRGLTWKDFPSYEEALERGLQEAFKLIKDDRPGTTSKET